MMKRDIITISENGSVNVPANVQMSDYEIAQLLGVMVTTIRGAIKWLLNSRPLIDSSGGVVRGNRIVPEYFGLEVVIAIAFQVDSYEAEIFRKWVIRGVTNCDTPMKHRMFITFRSSQTCN